MSEATALPTEPQPLPNVCVVIFDRREFIRLATDHVYEMCHRGQCCEFFDVD